MYVLSFKDFEMYQLFGVTQNVAYWNTSYRYNDVIMSTMASQITSLTTVYLTVYSRADQRKHQSSASLAFVRGIHRWSGEFPAQRASNAENVSIRWRHHAILYRITKEIYNVRYVRCNTPCIMYTKSGTQTCHVTYILWRLWLFVSLSHVSTMYMCVQCLLTILGLNFDKSVNGLSVQ